MAESTENEPEPSEPREAESPRIQVAPAPHISAHSITTRWMMLDVLIALVPVLAVSIYIFRWYAIVQVGICILSCLAAEGLFLRMRGRSTSFDDFSATITGAILGLSLPWSAPWYIGVIGGFVAIGLGKAAFGGLGFNLFNPAMVGRAFVMLSFAKALSAAAYIDPAAGIVAITQATPLTAAKEAGAAAGIPDLWPMFLGNVNGSLGETSAIAILAGGIYLCFRRSASWEIPLSILIASAILAGIFQVLGFTTLTIPQQWLGGSLLFGAFFIATDPVSSPVTVRGKWIFGAGVGILIVSLRTFSSYPEGVMFAVLLMNAATPLINRWTVPVPVGGPVPQPQKQ